LFQAEYLRSTENRYRFAWIVATVDPTIQADDVDRDLTLTARRALDKNWQRRSILTLEGFLADAAVHKLKALQLLGVALDKDSIQQADDLTARLQRVREVAGDLQDAFTEHLRSVGVTAHHEVRPGPHDTTKQIIFWWNAPADPDTPQRIELRIELQLLAQGNIRRFGLTVQLDLQQDNQSRSVSMVLPETPDDAGVGQRLLGNVVDAFGQLAMDISRADAKGGGG
jgi:hypothetical protein